MFFKSTLSMLNLFKVIVIGCLFLIKTDCKQKKEERQMIFKQLIRMKKKNKELKKIAVKFATHIVSMLLNSDSVQVKVKVNLLQFNLIKKLRLFF